MLHDFMLGTVNNLIRDILSKLTYVTPYVY